MYNIFSFIFSILFLSIYVFISYWVIMWNTNITNIIKLDSLKSGFYKIFFNRKNPNPSPKKMETGFTASLPLMI